ncbi:MULTISPECIES: ATP-binding protein [unclassified Leptolyngbya]|nr:sensor histidine kinase [Leptolyngbya sp. FACHB-8]MBD2156605.1 sensor histidine kinase [Leptolyngbya sp. FACHB-16]
MVSIPLPNAGLPRPFQFEASTNPLSLNSTVGDLPLHWWAVDGATRATEVANQFEQYPEVPGVILQQDGQLLGLMARQRFLEYLLRPYGSEWFLAQPMRVLYSYARCPYLLLPAQTPILQAVQQALRRSPEQRPDPIVVQREDGLLCLLDIHELYRADWQIRGIETQVRFERFHLQMVQHEKMAALGRLVDGVAHEILDPVGFIWGNLVHLSDYVNQLMELLSAYDAAWGEVPADIAALQESIELDYLKADLPRTLTSIQTGASRLKKLASSLQTFCHIDEVYPKPADLHDCLDSLVLLLESRLTGEIRFTRQYGHLPPVPCYLGQLSQVFISLLSRAVEVLLNPALQAQWNEGTPSSCQLPAKPEITITTEVYSDLQGSTASRWVVICIADNGPPLSPWQHQQIQDSFSVEQRATRETNLAMSYQIVTARHGGRLELRSPSSTPLESAPLQEGTEFKVWLPLM